MATYKSSADLVELIDAVLLKSEALYQQTARQGRVFTLPPDIKKALVRLKVQQLEMDGAVGMGVDPTHTNKTEDDVIRCAEWIMGSFRELGKPVKEFTFKRSHFRARVANAG